MYSINYSLKTQKLLLSNRDDITYNFPFSFQPGSFLYPVRTNVNNVCVRQVKFQTI